MSKVLFWDFDGTLVHSEMLWSKSVYHTLQHYGYDIDFLDIRKHLKTGFTWHTPDEDYSAYTGDRWWPLLYRHFNQLYQQVGAQKDADLLNQKVRERILMPEHYILYEDTIETLKACTDAGFSNYILSNNYPELKSIIRSIGLEPYFEDSIISALIGYDKPRREIFEYAWKRGGCPKRCYMIGDNPDADIEGAKAFGMRSILVHNTKPCEADAAFADLRSIPAWLNKNTN